MAGSTLSPERLKNLERGVVVSLLAFSVVFLLYASLASASCCGSCSVRVYNIDVEKVDSVNKDHLCPGDRFRVSAYVSVSGDGERVDAKLFINGEFYDNEIVYVSGGTSREIIFDRIVDSGDWIDCSDCSKCSDCSDCGCSNCNSCDCGSYKCDYCGDEPEIRVVAEADCGSDEETFSLQFDDWCWDYWNYDYGYCHGSDYCHESWCYGTDYGRLKVRVTDCADGDAVTDATVEVERGNYHVKTTNYDGYATFTLQPGTYTVTVTAKNHEENEKEVKVYAGSTKTLSVCVGNECEEGYTSDFQCFGKAVQRKYVNSDCSEEWKVVEYCEAGCSSGSCTSATSATTATATSALATGMMIKPLFSLKPTYAIKACEVTEFTFDVVNLGPEREFDFTVEGAGEDLVYVPHSLNLSTGEHEVTAYAYTCEPGQYEFSIKATAEGEDATVTSTSSSVLVVSEARSLISYLDAFLLSLVVIVVVLIVLKKMLPSMMTRIRRIARAEEFKRNALQ